MTIIINLDWIFKLQRIKFHQQFFVYCGHCNPASSISCKKMNSVVLFPIYFYFQSTISDLRNIAAAVRLNKATTDRQTDRHTHVTNNRQ